MTVIIKETLIPPRIARAKGAYDSLPSPSFNAIGISPKIVASEVISTGRKPNTAAVATASRKGILLREPMRELDDQNAVGNRDADHHHDAHQRHDIQAGAGQVQHQQRAGQSRRHSGQDQ